MLKHTRRAVSLLLTLALLLTVAPMTALAAYTSGQIYMRTFIDSPYYKYSAYEELESRFDSGESFIVVQTGEFCGNSRARRSVLKMWAEQYHINIYGLANEDYAPYWLYNFSGGSKNSWFTPLICIVTNGNAVTYAADDSMIDIQIAVAKTFGISGLTNTDNIGFYYLNSHVRSENRSDAETLAAFLLPSNDIQSDNADIVKLSNEIVGASKSDYAKVKAIHDWVAENVYYDWGMVSSERERVTDALGVCRSPYSVCEGFANLTAALCRAAGIPAKVVTGFATGATTADKTFDELFSAYQKYMTNGDLAAFKSVAASYCNHAWNEVYADGRWIILDTTWDSSKEYYYNPNDVSVIRYRDISQTYFDPNLADFSESHLFWDMPSLPAVADPKPPADTSSASTWAKAGIAKADQLGLVTEELQTNYQTATTRAEFCRAAVNFLRKYGYNVDGVTPKLFADTSDKDIGIAAALGITSGTDAAKNLFSPNAALTREQAATMLNRVLGVIGKSVDAKSVAWSDASAISAYAVQSVNSIYSAGVMNGTSTSGLVFSPQASYTHEASIVTFVRLWEFVGK